MYCWGKEMSAKAENVRSKLANIIIFTYETCMFCCGLYSSPSRSLKKKTSGYSTDQKIPHHVEAVRRPRLFHSVINNAFDASSSTSRHTKTVLRNNSSFQHVPKPFQHHITTHQALDTCSIPAHISLRHFYSFSLPS